MLNWDTPKAVSYTHLDVYKRQMQGLEQAKVAEKGLRSAAGFIRRELGHRLKLRHVPQLIFTATDSIEYGAGISKLINDLKEEKHHED